MTFRILLCCVSAALPAVAATTDFYVSPAGSDAYPGSRSRPFLTLSRARKAVRQVKSRGAVNVYLRGGVYYLPDTLVFTPEDSGTAQAPVTWQAWQKEVPVLSGGVRLAPAWEAYRGGIVKAHLPFALDTDQLFVNGERQQLARYPNFDPAVRHFNGYAADAFSPDRAARWSDPRGGFIHAMHLHEWGDFHYVITGKDAANEVTYEGGWQNNRRLGMHATYRMVENIFEELDAPGEWFLDRRTRTLYFYPPVGLDMKKATVEAVRLRHVVEFRGSAEKPVRQILLKGITFRHAARTFMENKEPLLRSDWTTYRGGAVLFEGAEDSGLEDCTIDQVGGNAVFVSGYNRRITVKGCEISRAGANAIAFVGDPRAVRSPLFEYAERQSLTEIDRTAGPKSPDYPADSLVDDCLIYQSGRFEKQTAGVQIAMAQGITVRHSSIYEVPRAGVNIGDGTWGGHVIEFCDIFDTVLETGDHGSFNSWGRDRYWLLKDVDMNRITVGANRGLPLLDAVKPVILRNNRWRCDHGWDIDLDDGSSNYEIRNNLCLNGGLKNREGFFRVVENNIIAENSFHPHVWFQGSEDVFRRNIIFRAYQPIRVERPWGKDVDYNLLHTPGAAGTAPAKGLQGQSGRDEHSLTGDALFVDAANGDYRVKPGSPALKLGFQNFAMDQFGVSSPRLRAIAKTPKLPGPAPGQPLTLGSARDPQVWTWLGARVRNVLGFGEVSAAGLLAETGVLVLDVPAGSAAARSGLRKDDVVLRLGTNAVGSLDDLQRLSQAAEQREITVFREQREQKMVVERR
jgi:hypothetical protein